MNILNADDGVKRDRKRLEQHYQDVISFLNRSERGSGLVEEQELESATVERYKLQKYAREAMSFLEKAFREEPSIMVNDDEMSPSKPGVPPSGRTKEEEDKQIAADRAALQRYDAEFGDFLSRAYDDDNEIIVEDVESDASVTDRGLYARRMAPSTTSNDTYSEELTHDENSVADDEVFTDDEFQDPELADSQMEILERNMPVMRKRVDADVYHDGVQQRHEDIRDQVQQYELEADDYLEGANVSESEHEPDTDEAEGGRHLHRQRWMNSPSRQSPVQHHADVIQHDVEDEDEEEDDIFGADHHIEEERQLSHVNLNETTPTRAQRSPQEHDHSTHDDDVDVQVEPGHWDDSSATVVDEAEVSSHHSKKAFVSPRVSPPQRATPTRPNPPRSSPLPRGSPLPGAMGVPRASPRRPAPSPVKHGLPPRSPDSKSLMVDIKLEDKTGNSRDWSEMTLEKSFYRQLPRGFTIKLRPKQSPQLSASSRNDSDKSSSNYEPISLADLQRVEEQRNAALATLEEIVNERSMLAAQVSEMKRSMIVSGHGGPVTLESNMLDEADTDLAAELKDARETMAALIDEMEATLSVLDERYQETLQRAHKAEEKCIRLETSASRLQSEFAQQGVRLSQSIAEQKRLKLLMSKTEREYEVLRKKSESDIRLIDETYREESERSLRKIRELTSEISVLREKLRSGASSVSERGGSSRSQVKLLEAEIASLKRRVAESDRKLADERAAEKRKLETEVQRVKMEHENEVRQLSATLERVKGEAEEGEDLRKQAEKHKSEYNAMSSRVDALEQKLSEVQAELIDARRGQVTAEAEAKHVRMRYEESLKKRVERMDQSTEMLEIQTALKGLREEAATRERALQQQLQEVRKRAEEAEAAAADAEADAKEAAEMVKRAKADVEAEKKDKSQLEVEIQRLGMESRAWQKFAHQQMEQSNAKDEVQVAVSSSRRGLRKSPSKNAKDGKRKKDARAGSSEETGKKKSTHRSRLFG